MWWPRSTPERPNRQSCLNVNNYAMGLNFVYRVCFACWGNMIMYCRWLSCVLLWVTSSKGDCMLFVDSCVDCIQICVVVDIVVCLCVCVCASVCLCACEHAISQSDSCYLRQASPVSLVRPKACPAHSVKESLNSCWQIRLASQPAQMRCTTLSTSNNSELFHCCHWWTNW